MTMSAAVPLAEPNGIHAESISPQQETPLSEKHLADLHKSGLSDDQIAKCGFRTSRNSSTVTAVLKWTGTGSKSLGECLTIPYFRASGEEIPLTEFARIKPDNPRRNDGKPIKYESPKGSCSRLYLPPSTWQFLSDSSMSLVFTEGEKKAAKADQEGFACIGLGGVWSWSKPRDDKSKPFELIPDFEHVTLVGSEVFIVFDSDLAENENVQRAEWELTQALERRGAIVKVVRLPNGPIDVTGKPSKVGLDDYLIAHSADGLQRLIDSAIPPIEPKKAAKSEKPKVVILLAGTKVLCDDRGNVGEVVSDDGGPEVVVRWDGEKGTCTKPMPRVALRYTNGQSVVSSKLNLEIRSAGELVSKYTQLRPPIIEGLLRKGETMNVISAPKVGKSWLVLGLALSVACGRKWLDMFVTARGKVLLCDNELHPETLADRLPRVATAMGLTPEDYADNFSVANLRGRLVDLPALSEELMNLKPGAFDLIILDAWYRLQPEGTDENSNADVTALYNLLDSVAYKIGCAFVCVHHTSKGNQSGKAVTDVGSGAGAQARAPDSHLIMRQHEHDGAFVVDASVRSFPPVKPFVMRRDFPNWLVDQYLNPSDLRKEKPRKPSTPNQSDGPSKDEIRQQQEEKNRQKVLIAFELFPDGETNTAIRNAAGLNTAKFGPIHADLLREGIIERCSVQKNKRTESGFRFTPVGRTRTHKSHRVRPVRARVARRSDRCPPL